MTGVLRRLAFLLPLLLLLTAALRLHSSTTAPDDAFITLRYADNLARGEGFRYNPGGERVEGFSSPLHVLLLAGLKLAGVPLEEAAQSIGLFSALGLVLLAWTLGRRLLGVGWGTLAACGLALNPALAYWSRGGLETTLAALLVLAALDLALRGREIPAFLAVGLIATVRPEGPLYGVPLVLWIVMARDRAESCGEACRRAARLAVLAALLPLGWLVFRLAYFGELLPNTYYAKMDGVRLVQIQRGLAYVGRWLARAEIRVPLALAAAGAGPLLARRLRRQRASAAAPGSTAWIWLAAGSGVATVAFAVLAGGDHLEQYRFLLPAVAPLQLMGAWGCRTLVGAIPKHSGPGAARPWRAFLAIVLGGTFLSQGLRIAAHEVRHPRQPLDRPWRLVEARDDSHICHFYGLGLAMRQRAAAGESIAVVPAGAIAYASGLTVVDMLGLNDPEIAHQKVDGMGGGHVGHEKGRGYLVLRRRPTYVLLHHQPEPLADGPRPPTDEDLTFVPVRELWQSADFHRLYEPIVVPLDAVRGFTLYRLREPAS